ncbi:MAG TPA: glycosyltransferase family 4 protein, partial [Actinopolymorphaceae bacterium]
MSEGRERRVLVLQAAALPRSQGGATRHVELFGRLRGWSHLIVAGNRSNYTRQKYHHRTEEFVTVPVPGYASNGIGRVLNWLTYAIGAFFVGLWQRRISVVFGSSPHLMAPIAGWALAKIKRVPFVLEVRDLWPRSMVELGYLREGSRVHKALVRLEGFLYRAAERIVVVVPGWQEHFASFGIPPEKLVVVSNGADPDDFAPTSTREKARAQLGVDGFVLIYAGAHGPANGLDQILDAAKHLHDCTFLLVGDGLEKARLMERVRDEIITNVRFHDPVPKSELGNVFVAADVGLHTLTQADLFRDGISPNKLWDYMAAGLAVITNVGGDFEKLIVDL